MPLQMIRNDITKVKADAIVNTANPKPVIGAGTDSAIYKAAGEKKLLAARELIGDIKPGQAIETAAYNLEAKFIIHTVCCGWKDGKKGKLDVLGDCYYNSLQLAAELGCKSIAFPLIGTGAYGFPHDDAIGVAKDTINAFFKDTGSDMRVMLVLFDQTSMKSGEAISKKIRTYIDDNYVENAVVDEYGFTQEDWDEMSRLKRRRELYHREFSNYHCDVILPQGSNEQIAEDFEKPFGKKALELAKDRGIKKSALYGGKYELYFSKQIMSNITNDDDYHPSKYVCVVICLVLKLDLNQTLDLLERAGWTLSRSRKADVVVRACIDNGIHDVYTVNRRLEENGCEELKQIK